MTTHYTLRLFGGFRLEDGDGTPVRIPLRKGEALLAYLACAPGEPVSREKLAALLWSERDDRRARQNLRQVLHALSRAVAGQGVSILHLPGRSVALDAGAVWVDAVEFERLSAEGSAKALGRAAALYRGEFLAHLRVEAPAFEDWRVVARTRFQDLAMKCLSGLLEHQERAGQAGAAIGTADRALRIDPYREDIHRRLMALYAASGMRGSALAQYLTCREVLQRELRVAPEQETTELYRRILAQGPSHSPGTAASRSESWPAGLDGGGRDGPSISNGITVGRRDELAALVREFARAADGGSRLVTVAGEAGVGKSHLLDVFARDLATQGAAVFWTRARRAERTLPLALWSDLLDGLAPHRSEARVGISAGLRDEQAPFRASSVEAGDTQGDLGGAWRRAYDSAVRLVRARANRAAVALIFEDLQWADGESLGLLLYALRRLRQAPVLFVATFRPDDPRGGEHLSRALRDLERSHSVRRIALAPLSREQTSDLVGRLQAAIDAQPVSQARNREIWAISEGNPRIVVEKVLSRAGDGSGKTESLPDAARRDVSRILSRLSEPARRLVTVASVMGSRCEFRAVRRAAGLREEAVVRALEELVAAHVLRLEGERVAFVRRRVRLALYAELLAPRRKAMHAAAARAIALTHAGELEPQCRRLAHHYRHAGRTADAFVFEVRSGEVELDRGQRRTARGWFLRALKTARRLETEAPTETWKARAALGLATVAELDQDLDAALEVLRPLERRLDRLDGGRERAESLYALARIHFVRGDEQAAYDHARRALRDSERHGGDRLWLPAERLLFRLHVLTGAHDRVLERLTCMRQRARTYGLRADEADAAAALAVLHATQAGCDMARSEAAHALQVAEDLQDDRRVAGCLQILGMAQAWHRDAGAALANFDRAAAVATGRGDVLRLYALHGHRGLALCVAGRHDEAVAELSRAVEAAGRLGTRFYLPLFMAWLAEAGFEAGHHDAALDHGREALRLAQDANQPWPRSVALRTLARVLGHPEVRDLAVAERAVRSALAEQQGLGLDFERARSLMVHARILRTGGDIRGSSALYGEAGRMFGKLRLTAQSERARRMGEALRPVRESTT
ncbi:MAG: BTAD domain-containing putative transcriptional regulator [Kiloniellaceae bacterium]